MRDPFPFTIPPAFERTATRITNYTNLETLPLHFHEILTAFAFYHIVCSYISPALSSRLLPNRYKSFNDKTKLNWNVHVTSFVQSTLICALTLYVLRNDEELAAMDYRERVWGYTGATGLVQALGCGYFLWDFWISLENVRTFGFGLLAHAASAFWVYSMGFRPFVVPYSPVFLLYELSSPFLNIHWALDKLDRTGSNLQLVNGIFLMSSFFGSRLVWGVYKSYCVFKDMFAATAYQNTAAGKAWLQASSMAHPAGKIAYKPIPPWYAFTYLAANIVLTILNVYWFGKMVETIRKRFDPPFGTRQVGRKSEPTMGRGIDSEGVKSVEVSSEEVRRRVKSGVKGEDPDLPPPAH